MPDGRRCGGGGPCHVGDRRTAAGQRTGLVQGHRGDSSAALQIAASLHEDAFAGGPADSRNDGNRCGYDQRAGAPDDQNRQRQFDIPSDHNGPHGEDDDRRCVPPCKPLDEPLGWSLCFLCVLHPFHDARKRRVAGDSGRPDRQHGVLVDGPGENPGTRNLALRHRLSGDRALVHPGGAGGHRAVHRHPRSRLHHNRITQRNLFRRDRLPPLAAQDDRGGRRQIQELADDATRASHRPRLQVAAKVEQKRDGGGLPVVADQYGANRGDRDKGLDTDGARPECADRGQGDRQPGHDGRCDHQRIGGNEPGSCEARDQPPADEGAGGDHRGPPPHAECGECCEYRTC